MIEQIVDRLIANSGSNNISIQTMEIFVDDPTEAVSRIKQSQQRIILAWCYTDSCPLLACAVSRL